MSAQLIKGTTNHFVCPSGRVFKIEYGKEVTIHVKRTPKTKDLFVLINGTPFNYLFLMIEYFHPVIKITDKIKWKANKNGVIAASAISIKPFTSKVLSKEEDLLMFKYGCSTKATGANSRCPEIITPLQVYTTLKVHNFKCIYCLAVIQPANWHLDHFMPISRGGKNVFGNIVPSCPTCNTMKGALHADQFYRQCERVVKNYMFQKDIEETEANSKPKVLSVNNHDSDFSNIKVAE